MCRFARIQLYFSSREYVILQLGTHTTTMSTVQYSRYIPGIMDYIYVTYDFLLDITSQHDGRDLEQLLQSVLF